MPWMNLTCGGCGHTGDIDAFTSTPVFGALPKNTYQCPACGLAIEKRLGTPELLPSGFVMPGEVELVVVESRL